MTDTATICYISTLYETKIINTYVKIFKNQKKIELENVFVVIAALDYCQLCLPAPVFQ